MIAYKSRDQIFIQISTRKSTFLSMCARTVVMSLDFFIPKRLFFWQKMKPICLDLDYLIVQKYFKKIRISTFILKNHVPVCNLQNWSSNICFQFFCQNQSLNEFFFKLSKFFFVKLFY